MKKILSIQNLPKFFAGFLGFFFILLPCARYFSLSSNVADLGFHLNTFFNLNNSLSPAFTSHAQILLPLFSTLYQGLGPELAPIGIILLQSIFLLTSVIAVWKTFGCWPGMAMLLYYPLWVLAQFDFHMDHLVVPLLVGFFMGCQKERFGLSAFFAVLLSFTKEPFCLQTAACGLYFFILAFRSRGKDNAVLLWTLGGFLFLYGFISFYVLTEWFIPYFGQDKPNTLNTEAFAWLGQGLWEKLKTICLRPDLAIFEIFSVPRKLYYLVVIFGLVAFIPLLRPSVLVVAAPILMISLLSREDNYYGYANHYTAGVIVPVMMAFRDGLPVAKKLFSSGIQHLVNKIKVDWEFTKFSLNIRKLFSISLALWLLIGHWAFASSPIARLFWSEKIWSYSWQSYVPTDRTRMIKKALTDFVPTNSGVSVSSQNSLNWGHLANRKTFLIFPLGIKEPVNVLSKPQYSWKKFLTFIESGETHKAVESVQFADFVIIDLKRPYFLLDQGCDWVYGECRNQKVEKDFFSWLSFLNKNYENVFQRDQFFIFRHPQSK